MIVPFFIFDATTGDPATGLTPTFNYYKRRNADGSLTDLADPSITERGGGLYEFTTAADDLIVGTVVAYVVDCGASAQSRYATGTISGDAVSAPTYTATLAGNALTTVATVRTVLGLTDTSQDATLVRLINGASDSIEKYCGRRFAYDEEIIEQVRGYGTELIHLDRFPVWAVASVTIDGDTVSADDYKIRDHETGSLFGYILWPNTAPIESTISPHYRAGYEDKLIEVTYSGGFALAVDSRLASDCTEWAGSTAYVVGDKVVNSRRVYQATQAGTSASSGGPASMRSSITDGSVTWEYLCENFTEPSDLEEACIQLAVYRFRRLGKDPVIQQESIGRTSRMYGAGPGGLPSIPAPITDLLDQYRRVR